MSAPAHRSVSSIRPSISEIRPREAAPASPRTPVRAISSSSFGSPSALRAEEECFVLEFGSRYLRAGFAGDALPKAIIGFGPDEQRSTGDYRQWQRGYNDNWRQRTAGKGWGEAYELWKPDLRHVDLGLVGDKIERAMREAITKYLVTGSASRRVMLILAPDIPLPLLSTMLDTLFSSFQPPTISLLSAPVLTTMAAALRSSLVIDIGWAETTVTAVYEYREVFCRRTVRASKLLGREMLKLLEDAIRSQSSQDDTPNNKLISFEECEEVVTRMAWCRPSATSGLASVSGDLSSALEDLQINEKDGDVSISLRSTQPPMRLKLPFSSLAEPCENALFAKDVRLGYVDDEELPLHLLVYRALLQLPVDVRSVCMSRLIFTGGASNIPGLKSRILGDVQGIVDARGWNPVQGEVVADIRSRQRNLAKESSVPTISTDGEDALSEADVPAKPAAFRGQEPDPIESQLRREKNKTSRPSVHGTLRAVDSMGAWSGGSLISQLRVPLVSVVEKEQWLQYGLAGASKAKEVVPAKQRQSMGPAGLRAVAGEQTGWTLGPWG